MRKDPDPNCYAADTRTVVLVYTLLLILGLAEGVIIYSISQLGA